MRLISFLLAAATLAACGTKTPLSLPSPAAPTAVIPAPPVDNSNKAATEPRQ